MSESALIQTATSEVTFSAADAVIVYSVKEKALDEYKERFAIVPSDLSVRENYDLVAEGAALGRKMSGTLEKERKAQVADALEWQRKVNAKAKEIEARISAIKDPLVEAKKTYDTRIEIEKREAAAAEERRVDAINEKIISIRTRFDVAISQSSKDIEKSIEDINGLASDLSWAEEFQQKACDIIRETLTKLHEIHAMRVTHEENTRAAEAAEAKRKAEEEECRRQERIALATREAELDAERRRLAAERAELEKMARKAEAAAYKEAVDTPHLPVAERIIKDVAATVAPKTEDAYKAAGKAMKAIIGDFAKTKQLLDLIISGDIPHITFNV